MNEEVTYQSKFAKEGLTFDDVLLVPQKSNILPADINISTHLTKKIKLSRLRVYVTCDNIWYCSYRQGLDPRSSFSGGTNYASNSPVRTITGGINITF